MRRNIFNTFTTNQARATQRKFDMCVRGKNIDARVGPKLR